jgi:hypothetical protein
LNGSLLREEEGLVAGRGLITGYTGEYCCCWGLMLPLLVPQQLLQLLGRVLQCCNTCLLALPEISPPG